MTTEIAREIAQCLSADSAYYQMDPRCRTWTTNELKLPGRRYGLAWNDLSLGWNIPWRYAQTGHTLPLVIQKYLPFRLFRYLTSYTSRDRAMSAVVAFWASPGQRVFLKAALTARDASLLQIAEWCGLTPEQVVLLSRLAFNIRARWNDRAFMTELLRLDGSPRPAGGGAEDNWQQLSNHELRLVRPAFRKGIAGLWKALRYPGETGSANAQENVGELLEETSQQTLASVLQGQFNADNNPAQDLLQVLSRMQDPKTQKVLDEDLRRGLGGMGLALALGEAAKRVAKPDLDTRLALQAGPVGKEGNNPPTNPGLAPGEKAAVSVGADGFPEALPPANWDGKSMTPRAGT